MMIGWSFCLLRLVVLPFPLKSCGMLLNEVASQRIKIFVCPWASVDTAKNMETAVVLVHTTEVRY
jgi:hypothetical protein